MFPPPASPRPPSGRPEDHRPDPVFMVLRHTFGWFAARLDAWQEAREDRREARAAIAQANAIVRTAEVASWSAQPAREDVAA